MSPTSRCDSLVETRQMRLGSWLVVPEARPVETSQARIPVATARLPRRDGPGFQFILEFPGTLGPLGRTRSAVCSGSPHADAVLQQHSHGSGDGKTPKKGKSLIGPAKCHAGTAKWHGIRPVRPAPDSVWESRFGVGAFCSGLTRAPKPRGRESSE